MVELRVVYHLALIAMTPDLSLDDTQQSQPKQLSGSE
jgi:hypothetical protein